MRFLLLSSFLGIMAGCSSTYKNLQTIPGDVHDILQFKPVFNTVLYKAGINITGNYLSGLLLIKKMPDSSTRLVFSNETGFKFFDFEFSKNGTFKVHYILKKMDRKAVIKTLRKDFELVLMAPINLEKGYIKAGENSSHYFIFPQTKGYYTFITDSTVNDLVKMERASRRKTVVTVIAQNYVNGLPDTIGITHNNFNFTIGLKKIDR